MKVKEDKMKLAICELCSKNIFLTRDDFVKVTDFRRGEFVLEKFYHNKCFLDRINKGSEMQRTAMGLAKRVTKMMDKIEGNSEEDNEILVIKGKGKE